MSAPMKDRIVENTEMGVSCSHSGTRRIFGALFGNTDPDPTPVSKPIKGGALAIACCPDFKKVANGANDWPPEGRGLSPKGDTDANGMMD